MRAPLTVRVSDGVRDQQVTRFVKGLRFTKTAPGGHHSASVSIDAPTGLFGDLGPADRVYIYDGRTADTVWDGYVENPGRQSVAGGETYDLSAMGGVVLASDNAQAVVFRSRNLSGAEWQRRVGSLESATAEVNDSVIPEAPAIKAMFQPGTPVATGDQVAIINHALTATGQRAHSLTLSFRGGKDDYLWQFVIAVANPDLATFVGGFVGLTTAEGTTTVLTNGTLGPGAVVFLGLTYRGASATNVTDNLTWAAFYRLVVTPQLVATTGGDATPTDVGYVRPDEVVAHIVGAMLPGIDGTSAVVQAATRQIDNLSYLEAVKPSQILDDLSLWEPDYLWEILESNAAGKHRFAYRAWPTTPRYEISGRTFTESGGEIDLSNRVVVNWTDELGAKQTTVRTTVVEALGSRVKDAEPITLPEGMGSESNAIRIGDEVLAALNTPARSGSATISEPIFDRLASKMVMPWEIEPGYLVRVRDRGVDLRLTEMTYEDDSVTTSITLGSPVLSLEQRLARLRR